MYVLRVKLILLCILLSALYAPSKASIQIDMEPDELQEFLQGRLSGRPITTITPRSSSVAAKHVKRLMLGLIQMVGIMLTLVGANLLTALFEPSLLLNGQCVDKNVTVFLPSIAPSQLCEYDFGCDRNLCWRTCGAGSDNNGKNDAHSWCYTAAKTESHNYQQCIYSHDCSPCWECLGACHSQVRKIRTGL